MLFSFAEGGSRRNKNCNIAKAPKHVQTQIFVLTQKIIALNSTSNLCVLCSAWISFVQIFSPLLDDWYIMQL